MGRFGSVANCDFKLSNLLLPKIGGEADATASGRRRGHQLADCVKDCGDRLIVGSPHRRCPLALSALLCDSRRFVEQRRLAENAIELVGPPLHRPDAFDFVVGPVVDRHDALHRVVQDFLGDMRQHPERVEARCACAAQVMRPECR